MGGYHQGPNRKRFTKRPDTSVQSNLVMSTIDSCNNGGVHTNMRIKPKRLIKRDKPEALSVPGAINQVWSMDFMSDSLIDGWPLRIFNVIDDYNREGLAIDVDLSTPSLRVIRSLEQVIEWRGKPTQNAYVERFNRTVRHEWLNKYVSESVEQAQALATESLWKYINERSNMAIGGVPPKQLLKAA